MKSRNSLTKTRPSWKDLTNRCDEAVASLSESQYRLLKHSTKVIYHSLSHLGAGIQLVTIENLVKAFYKRELKRKKKMK